MKIEEVFADANSGGDWGGIDQISPNTRVGYAGNFVVVERTLPNGDAGVYCLPFIEQENFESFLAWKASLAK